MLMNKTTLIAVGIALSIATVATGLILQPGSSDSTQEALPIAATADYGRKLLRDTALYLGPNHEDPDMRYSGTNMACASCHIDVGMRPGTLSLLQADSKYPRPSGRDGKVGDLRDRINGCMQRSMNGKPLPRNSVEMIAMETYIKDLGNQYLAMSESHRMPIEPEEFREPDRAANVAAGEVVFVDRCQVCHGSDGAGLLATSVAAEGYLFPPLWGPDSFNNGAGMTRVLTAARFIKARMPYGQADLSDDQAYDVAAYINSHSRPIKANLEVDFPDRTKKRVDSPYPPYADPFPIEQHRLGPFKPIREYYAELKKESSKTDNE